MNLVRYRRGKRRSCVAALTLLATSFFAAQKTTHPSNQLDQTQRTIRDLARKFTEILAPTPIETQLQAKCAVNCSGVRDSKTGLTVAQELENIEARKRIEMAGVASEIQKFVDDYMRLRLVQAKSPLMGNR